VERRQFDSGSGLWCLWCTGCAYQDVTLVVRVRPPADTRIPRHDSIAQPAERRAHNSEIAGCEFRTRHALVTQRKECLTRPGVGIVTSAFRETNTWRAQPIGGGTRPENELRATACGFDSHALRQPSQQPSVSPSGPLRSGPIGSASSPDTLGSRPRLASPASC
jgi:hypothetical protein